MHKLPALRRTRACLGVPNERLDALHLGRVNLRPRGGQIRLRIRAGGVHHFSILLVRLQARGGPGGATGLTAHPWQRARQRCAVVSTCGCVMAALHQARADTWYSTRGTRQLASPGFLQRRKLSIRAATSPALSAVPSPMAAPNCTPGGCIDSMVSVKYHRTIPNQARSGDPAGPSAADAAQQQTCMNMAACWGRLQRCQHVSHTRPGSLPVEHATQLCVRDMSQAVRALVPHIHTHPPPPLPSTPAPQSRRSEARPRPTPRCCRWSGTPHAPTPSKMVAPGSELFLHCERKHFALQREFKGRLRLWPSDVRTLHPAGVVVLVYKACLPRAPGLSGGSGCRPC